jgi:NodT family efflux transporter outer membrane factor (OMF) lipoprotein
MPGAARGALAALLCSLTAAGCAVGPRYKRPDAPVPPAFKEAPPPAGPDAKEWKPAEPADERARGPWWEVFGDPRLNELEQKVSVSNQNVAQAEAQFRVSRAVAKGARADLFPTVSVTPSVTRSRFASSRAGIPNATSETATTYQLAGDASYEVDVWGRVRRNLESTVESAQATAGDLEAIRLSIQAELATDYFLLRGLDSQAQLLETTVDAYAKALQLTVDRHNQGVVSGVDVAQAETQLETTRAQMTDLLIQRAQLEHAIAVLTGVPPAGLTIERATIASAPPSVPPDLPAALLERRPDVASAERRVAAANAQIGVAVAGFFPQLLLNATGGWQSTSLTKFFSAPNLFWSLGASLAQTIFQGGKRVAAREQAIASYDAAVAEYRLSVLSSFQDVEDGLAELRLLADESDQQARAAAAAERALALAQNRYQGGITTYLEVITAQATALADERTAINLQTRRLTSSVALIKALGGGWSTTELPRPGEILWGGGAAAAEKK